MTASVTVRRLASWIVLACICVSLSAFGQKMNLHPPTARAAALAEVMREQLSLTPEQTAAVRETAEKYAEATDAARGQYTRRKLKQQVKTISEARDAEFRNILTADQFAAYQKGKRDIMKAMKARMKGTAPDSVDPTAAPRAAGDSR